MANQTTGLKAPGVSSAQNGFSDHQRLLKLAYNSFSKEKYSMTIDYCRKTVADAAASDRRETAMQAYYLWCLSNLKLQKPDDARKVCYEARLKLGNYLDLVYFEMVIAALKGENEKVPRFARNFIELYESAGGDFESPGYSTSGNIGEVLLMCGQALEQTEQYEDALEIFKKYIDLFPDDEPVRKHLDNLRMALQQSAERRES